MPELTKLETDLSILQKLNLEKPPVAIKFLFGKPAGLERLDKQMTICEMIPEAQKGRAFYTDKDNQICGRLVMGMGEVDPAITSGQLGPRLEVFKEARANRRIFEVLPTLKTGTCNYLAFASLDKLSFEPDVLIVTGTVRQAEIILRAASYVTGDMYESKGTSVLSCAWTLVYPFLTGKINFTVSGLTFGQITRKLGRTGDVIVSLPFNRLSDIIANLHDMQWVPSAYTESSDAYTERFLKELDHLAE